MPVVYILVLAASLNCVFCFRNDVASVQSARSANATSVMPDWPNLASQAGDLRKCYWTKYEFPAWSIDMLRDGRLGRYMETAEYYYTRGADVEMVKQLSLQREPVNIGMSRAYDKACLQHKMGWQEGAYAGSSRKSLLPNIAAYTQTPMREKDGSTIDVHLVNVIMAAFDSIEQPDYKYFFDQNSGQLTKWAELVARTSETFRFMFAVARRKKLRRVIAPFHYHRRRFFHHFLDKDANDDEERMWGKQLTDEAFEPVKGEFPDIEYVKMKDKYPHNIFPHHAVDLLANKIRFNPKEDLLVNSWDPWSIVGNGNCMDESTDGVYGCYSSVAILSWPRTNPFITAEKYVAVGRANQRRKKGRRGLTRGRRGHRRGS